MAPTRSKVLIKINDYINSFSADNNYLGGPDEQKLFGDLQHDFQSLSTEDKEFVTKEFEKKKTTTFTPRQISMIKNTQHSIIHGATIGAVAGAVGGAYFTASKIGALLYGGLGLFSGSYLAGKIAHSNYSADELEELIHKTRPYQRINQILHNPPVVANIFKKALDVTSNHSENQLRRRTR